MRSLLSEGMVKNQAFEQAIITPTTKDGLHDELISRSEILQQKIVAPEVWGRSRKNSP